MQKPTIFEIIDGRWLEFGLGAIVAAALLVAVTLLLGAFLHAIGVRDWRFR